MSYITNSAQKSGINYWIHQDIEIKVSNKPQPRSYILNVYTAE